MTIREKINEILDAAELKGREKIFERKKAYDKYFEGYEIKTWVSADGKEKAERVYTGKYYIQELEKKKCVLLRIAYCVLLALSFVLFALGATKQISNNKSLFVIAFYALSIVGYCWIIYDLIIYVTANRAMTIHEYKVCHISILRSTLYTVASLAASEIMYIVFCIISVINATDYLGSMLICMLFIALSVIPIWCICCIEVRLKYRVSDTIDS